MTNDEALAMAKQGFTAEEIRALGWSARPAEDQKAPEDQKTPEDVKEDQKTPEDVKSAENEAIKALTDTVNNLAATVKAIQESNQKSAKKTRGDNVPKSADEVVKGFIENM